VSRRSAYVALWVPNGLIVGCESLFVAYSPQHVHGRGHRKDRGPRLRGHVLNAVEDWGELIEANDLEGTPDE
jgi:hypothetical protein